MPLFQLLENWDRSQPLMRMMEIHSHYLFRLRVQHTKINIIARLIMRTGSIQKAVAQHVTVILSGLLCKSVACLQACPLQTQSTVYLENLERSGMCILE